MEQAAKDLVPYKYAIAFLKLLERNRKIVAKNKKNNLIYKSIVDSYGKLADEANLEKASLIRIFKGDICPTAITIDAILEAFDINHTQFGRLYDKVTFEEAEQYRKNVIEERKNRKAIDKKDL